MADDLRARMLWALTEHLRAQPAVRAAWLEGADALQRVDEFSDIDFCCAVTPEALEGVGAIAQSALQTLGTLDLTQRLTDRPDFQMHTVFHLAGASPYLLVDFVAYRAGRGSLFWTGDEIEKPLVLFDWDGLVTFRKPDEAAHGERQRRLQELRATVAQMSRLEKYLARGELLEAYGYYHKWLLQPLIEALRMVYTPLHSDYYIVHISRHLPRAVLDQLEDLVKFDSLDELARKSQAALRLFNETVLALEDRP